MPHLLHNRNYYFILILLCFALSCLTKWVMLAENSAPVLAGVSFTDKHHGWIAGGGATGSAAGCVGMTTDGGQQWNYTGVLGSFLLIGISMATKNAGVAAGLSIQPGGGTFYTTDGFVWKLSKTRNLNTHFYEVGNLNETFFWQVGAWVGESKIPTSGLQISTDGGRTFFASGWGETIPARSGQFLTENLGFMAGGSAGSVSQFPELVGGDIFQNPDSSVSSGEATFVALIAKTTDGGKRWKNIFVQNGTIGSGFYFSSISFVSQKIGWAVAQGVQSVTVCGYIYQTEDGGNSFQLQYFLQNGTFSKIQMLNSTHGWALGVAFGMSNEEPANGVSMVFFSTVDGGQKWEMESNFFPGYYPLDLDLLDYGSGYAVASKVDDSGSSVFELN